LRIALDNFFPACILSSQGNSPTKGNENEEMVCSRDSGFNTRNEFGSVTGAGSIHELHRFERCAAKFITQHDNYSFAASSSA
jgi:hypothetical protein